LGRVRGKSKKRGNVGGGVGLGIFLGGDLTVVGKFFGRGRGGQVAGKKEGIGF